MQRVQIKGWRIWIKSAGHVLFHFLFVAAVLMPDRICQAQTGAQDLFTRANEAYARQDFQEAADLYESIAAGGWESGALYYNLGNAYFRLNKAGRAVLNYERAMNFIPRDPDLRANFRYARSLTGRTAEEARGSFVDRVFRDFFNTQTFLEIQWVLLGGFFLLGGMHLWGLYAGWKRVRIFVILAALGPVIIFYALGFVWKMRYLSGRAVAVSGSSAYFEPRAGATVHFPLLEGDRVNIVAGPQAVEGWERVRRFDGKVGWVEADAIEKIIERD
jgi:hypothetical protein